MSLIQEPILVPDLSRFVTHPIKYPDLWEFFKKHEACFWTAEEIDLSADASHWERLTREEQFFITRILAFFAGSDGIVIENIASKFCSEVQVMEARSFYSFQMAMEAIHGETYSLLLQTYVKNPAELSEHMNAITTSPTVAKKATWSLTWMDSRRPFAERLVAFACVEGIFFSGSFCAIFWLKKRGLMPGLTFSNELIARDEGLHRDFACALFKHLLHKPDVETIHAIVTEAVDLEREFILSVLPVDLIGMNSALMSEYIEYVADHLLMSLGVEKRYGSRNPFDWMELLSIPPKANFFERRVGAYQKAGVMKTTSDDPFAQVPF